MTGDAATEMASELWADKDALIEYGASLNAAEA
jgi:hypothetical protein